MVMYVPIFLKINSLHHLIYYLAQDLLDALEPAGELIGSVLLYVSFALTFSFRFAPVIPSASLVPTTALPFAVPVMTLILCCST